MPPHHVKVPGPRGWRLEGVERGGGGGLDPPYPKEMLSSLEVSSSCSNHAIAQWQTAWEGEGPEAKKSLRTQNRPPIWGPFN